MLQSGIKYLMQNPDVKEKVIDSRACLVGLTKVKQKAVLDVFGGSGSVTVSPLTY